MFLLSDDVSNRLMLAKDIPLDGHHIFALMFRTNRIDVYSGDKFCRRMLVTCVTLMSRSYQT